MHISLPNLLLYAVCIPPILADFLGPSYPAPVDLSSNRSLVAAGWENLTTILQTHLNASDELSNVTFSIGMFSLEDPAASELQFHYTSPEVASAPNGTHKVDGDSIYRIASMTKVFTVLAGLLELNSTDWDQPLADIFPTLTESAQNNPEGTGDIYIEQWNEVTPRALAAQIAGVGRDINPYDQGDILYQILIAQATGEPGADPTNLGLPPVNQSDPLEFPPCALINSSTCPQSTYLEGAGYRSPTFLSWTTPGYADNGFALLGLAISKISGKSMEQLYRERIFDPLYMASSNSTTPPESEWYRSVIPSLPGFAYDAGLLVSTGGLLSTTHDLAKFGIGILNSTLLPHDLTRKWLKPVSHTARLQYSVGSPWEIMRYVHPSGHVTDIYTKSGDSGLYTSWLVILPDYNAGFSVLSSSSVLRRDAIVAGIADMVANSIIPALEAQAVAEAERNFVGTYTSSPQGVNSTLVLIQNGTESSPPGLFISSWISNGTDVVSKLQSTIGHTPWRLVPSISDPKSGKTAFRLVPAGDVPSPQVPGQLFSGPGYLLADWIIVDSVTYGGVGVGLFVFDIGSHGEAMAVSPAAFRITLNKTV
jgi:CubicO group peptidase (beta-lactamase class C family)